MATLDDIARELLDMRSQQGAMAQEIQRLIAENQVLRQAVTGPPPGVAEIANAVGQAVQMAMANATAAAGQPAAPRSLIDVKGLGKPPIFKGDGPRFNEWLRKATGFVIAAFGSTFRPVIEWVEDQDSTITDKDVDDQFGDTGHEPVDHIAEKNSQLHVALMALTEGESFDIVLGAAPNGLEALRRLVRRWDPLSGGRRRALLRQILVPERCKLQDLPAGLEKWEELVRRYEKRRAGGSTAALDDDIKTAALEALVPGELEQHLAMNRARITTYDQVRAEIQAYIEARRSQFALKVGAGARNPDAMDVDSFARWGKGGKGTDKGKKGGKASAPPAAHPKGGGRSQAASTDKNKEIECWNCGKKGHRSSECWAKPKAQASPGAAAATTAFNRHGKSPHQAGGSGGGRGKKGGRGGRGKGANSLDEEAHAHDDDVQQPALAGSLELSSFGFEGAAGAFHSPHLDPEGWLRWTYDTGAAITAFPVDARIGIETEPNAASYKTASGELIPDQGGLRVQGLSESGRDVTLEGRKADVHKTLVSAGLVAKKGHVTVLDNDGGYILPRGGRLTQRIQQLIRAEVRKEKLAVPLYKEHGTYVGYLKVPMEHMQMDTSSALAGSSASAVAGDGRRASPLCPVSRTSPGSSAPGGPRRPQA